MIIARAPLRITLGGGGSDLPAFYSRHGMGLCLAAAIDKYVYITVHETFVDDLIVKYSRLERVPDADHVEHPIVRKALQVLDIDGKGLEICSHADIPAGTGLGSSSSFTVALLKALHAYRREAVTAEQLAREACEIEIERLGEPIGKQDQYAAAFGGIPLMTFCQDGHVEVRNLRLGKERLHDLEDNLLLFFTGYIRQTAEVLNGAALPATDTIGLARRMSVALTDRHDGVGACLNEQWDAKEQRSPAPAAIVDWREHGLANGASGAKLVGAGGGGFLLYYASDRDRLRAAMALQEVRFRFDFTGATVVVE